MFQNKFLFELNQSVQMTDFYDHFLKIPIGVRPPVVGQISDQRGNQAMQGGFVWDKVDLSPGVHIYRIYLIQII